MPSFRRTLWGFRGWVDGLAANRPETRRSQYGIAGQVPCDRTKLKSQVTS